MPRANRSFIPEQIWHITHRCHKKEFLLKFKRDRERWLYWLYQAKKRFGLTVLDYIVTSNHIHLLVEDGVKNEVAQSMQLIAGRCAQEYNIRKKRQGALWSDRYHATAVDTDDYLRSCLTYIDLNMVRAGKVKHPSEWKQSGFNEIQNPPKRYQIIDRKRLCELAGINDLQQLSLQHALWIDGALKSTNKNREKKWTNSLAIGSHSFAESYAETAGSNGNRCKLKVLDGCTVVQEPLTSYCNHL